ncbi:MAG: TetR/AcrR family transcriptional regulator [Caldisericum sp.]
MRKTSDRKEEIIKEAINVFKEKRFDNCSISEIARRLGVRTSLIYYYFKNKDEIFREIVGYFRDELCKKIEVASTVDGTPFDKISSILLAYKDYTKTERTLYDIFREVEFVDRDLAFDFYERLTGRIKDALKQSLIEGLDSEAISYAILGSIYFVVIKNLIWENKPDIEKEFEVVKLVLKNGIDKIGNFAPYIIPKKELPLEETQSFESRGEKTRYSLIKAAEKLFGDRGYNETQISDIAYHAHVGLGTFYLYFNSKRDALKEVVQFVNKMLRKNSWYYCKDFTDRREIENAGIQAFFYQFKTMGNDYRIVRESEFIDKDIGVWYYTRIASSYARGLLEGMNRGEIIETDPETLAYILMGISHTVGIRWFVLNKKKGLSDKSILSVLEFIMHGLKGILKED